MVTALFRLRANSPPTVSVLAPDKVSPQVVGTSDYLDMLSDRSGRRPDSV